MALQRPSSALVAAPPIYELRPKVQRTETANNGSVQAAEPPSYSEVVTVSRPVSVPQLERDISLRNPRRLRAHRKWCYASLFLFPPSGIIALVCSVNTRNNRLTGHYDEAQLWSKRTYISNIVSTVVGVLALLLAFSLIVMKVLSASGPDYQEHQLPWSTVSPSEQFNAVYGRGTTTAAAKIYMKTTMASGNWRPVQPRPAPSNGWYRLTTYSRRIRG